MMTTNQERIDMENIDLLRFCDKDESTQYAMSQPWVMGKWKYATDRKILIRVPTDEADTVFTGRQPPPAGGLFVERITTQPLPWPSREYFRADQRCPQCLGKGEIGCDECNRMNCMVCNGSKSFEQDICLFLGENLIAPKYDALIRELPDVRYFPAKYSKHIPFIFTGGEGRVMGLDLSVLDDFDPKVVEEFCQQHAVRSLEHVAS
jgi:hypothetical protein